MDHIKEKIGFYEGYKDIEEEESQIASPKEIAIKLTRCSRMTDDPKQIVELSNLLNRMIGTYDNDMPLDQQEEERKRRKKRNLLCAFFSIAMKTNLKTSPKNT